MKALSPEAVRKLIKKTEREKWEKTLIFQIKAAGIPEPKTQYKFHPKRDFRADIAWPHIRFMVEVDGGTWLEKSAHSGAGHERDCIRDAEAFLLGWMVLRVTPGMIESGVAIGYIERLFYGRK